MGISTSIDGPIAAHLVAFEVLGADRLLAGAKLESPAVWVRCFIEFDNLAGEEVVDISVISDVNAGEQAFFANRSLHVQRFDEPVVRQEIERRIASIKGRDAKDVFAELDRLGFSATGE